MGHIGKLSRGMKYFMGNRDVDGNLKPNISNDYDKMLDVDYYLKYIKDKDKEKVHLALHQIFLLRQAAGGVRSQLFRDLKKKLDDGDFKVTKSVEKK